MVTGKRQAKQRKQATSRAVEASRTAERAMKEPVA